MASRFQLIEEGPPIEIFQVNKLYIEDTFQNKVDLGIGAYRDEHGKPWVLPVVQKVEKKMADDESLDHEYLPIIGLNQLSAASVSMLLGADNPVIAEGRAFGIQTISGCGAVRVAADLLNKHLNYTTFYYSSPSWLSYPMVFTSAGFTQPRTYRYWDNKTRMIDFAGMIEDLKNAPENSVVIMQACAHNPTGLDPTQEQWEKIADVIEERKLFPFFDSAYQGFATGDLDRDAWAVRYFVKRGFELVCAQSYAKMFGLYNERVGTLTLVVSDVACVAPLRSQLMRIISGMYSNPPAHGARIVINVLSDPALYDEWKNHIKLMLSRVIQMREALRSELVKLGTPGTWDHLVKQVGLFSFTGLTQRQCDHLTREHHIYLLRSGRINICGLNPSNVAYVARAIHDAVTKFPNASKSEWCQAF